MHYVHDQKFGEDRCQFWTGTAPKHWLPSVMRSCLCCVFHRWSNIAAAHNYVSHPQRALRLLGIPSL